MHETTRKNFLQLFEVTMIEKYVDDWDTVPLVKISSSDETRERQLLNIVDILCSQDPR